MRGFTFIVQRLSPFRPRVIRDVVGGYFASVCKLPSDGAFPVEVRFPAIILAQGDPDPDSLSFYDGNCLFVLGGSQSEQYRSCGSSVIFFPADTDPNLLYQETWTCINDMTSVFRASQRLYSAFGQRKGGEGIVATAAEILENPIYVTQLSLKNLFLAGVGVDSDPILAELMRNGKISEETAHHLSLDALYEQVYNREDAVLWTPPSPDYRPRLLCRILFRNKAVAHCTLVAANRPLHDTDADVLQHLSHVLSFEFERTSQLETNESPSQFFLESLYQNHFSSKEAMEQSYSFRKIKLGRWHAVLVISMESQNAQQPRRIVLSLESMISDALNYKTEYYILSMPDKWIVLLSYQQEKRYIEAEHALKEVLQSQALYGALSTPFEDLLQFRKIADLEESYIRVARRMGSEPGMVGRKNYFYPNLFSLLEHQVVLEQLIDPAISTLAAYDKDNDTHLLDTLDAYVKCGGSAQQTADCLFLHRNSVQRRIKSISQITGLIMHDADELHRLHLSLELYHFLKIQDKG